jgi:hypothetical protein
LSNLNHQWIGMRLLALTLVLWLLPASVWAHTAKTTRAAKKSSLTRSREAGSFSRRYHAVRERLGFARSKRHTVRRSTPYRARKRYVREAPTPEMSPQRAEQIQEALVQAGDLHETPTGLWDTETREAMKQYQSSNGFQPTGLPDAKSLMKLGLGPHPLPADVDPMAEAKTRASISLPNGQQTGAAASTNW